MEKLLLVCQYNGCNKYFKNPVGLPCCNTICKSHVDNLLDLFEENKLFKCTFCLDEHKIPENGFPPNKTYAKVLELNLHLRESEKEAQILLKKLKNLVNEFNLAITDPENFIYDYISNIKNKIDLHRENLIESIHSKSDEMFQKLLQYEKQCKENIKKNDVLTDKFTFDSNALINQIKKIDEELREQNKDQANIIKLAKQLNEKIEFTELEFEKYKRKLLNNQNCSFIPLKLEGNENAFGQLKLEEFNNESRTSNVFNNSLILNDKLFNQLVKLCDFDIKAKFDLIYRATRDGFKGEDFHRKCDDSTRTLVVIKVKENSNIFGGYTEASWKHTGYNADENSFIFSLVNAEQRPLKINVSNTENAIWCVGSFGPIFGAGYDFLISSNSNINQDSFSNLGYTYKHPDYVACSDKAENFLANSKNFSTSEIEVYRVS